MGIEGRIRNMDAEGVPWLATGRGAVDLDRPNAGDIDFHTIADALAQEPRWGGLTGSAPFSVAQHSILVMEQVSDAAKGYALLHDAHEAYLGDMPSPVAVAMERFARAYAVDMGLHPHQGAALMRQVLQGMKRVFDTQIFAAAGLNPTIPNRYAAEIKQADLNVLAMEATTLFPRPQNEILWRLFSAAGARFVNRRRPITPMPWADAADAWLTEFRIHCPNAGTFRRAG